MRESSLNIDVDRAIGALQGQDLRLCRVLSEVRVFNVRRDMVAVPPNDYLSTKLEVECSGDAKDFLDYWNKIRSGVFSGKFAIVELKDE